MKTTAAALKHVYVAGDGARVRGADAAEHAGRLAALAALKDLGVSKDVSEGCRTAHATEPLHVLRCRLARRLSVPARFAAQSPDDTIVCRCEAHYCGRIAPRRQRHGRAGSQSREGAFSRVGMVRCQGRFCAHAGAEVIAAEARIPLEAVGSLHGQALVKPLPMAISTDTATQTDMETAE